MKPWEGQVSNRNHLYKGYAGYSARPGCTIGASDWVIDARRTGNEAGERTGTRAGTPVVCLPLTSPLPPFATPAKPHHVTKSSHGVQGSLMIVGFMTRDSVYRRQ